jgi:hypothetical protein
MRRRRRAVIVRMRKEAIMRMRVCRKERHAGLENARIKVSYSRFSGGEGGRGR